MKTKKCDFCGKEFTGASYPVYDENWNKQKGIIQCPDCFGGRLSVVENENKLNK